MIYVVIIALTATPKAAERFLDKLDGLVIDETMEGGITALTTEEAKGKDAQRILEKLEEKE